MAVSWVITTAARCIYWGLGEAALKLCPESCWKRYMIHEKDTNDTWWKKGMERENAKGRGKIQVLYWFQTEHNTLRKLLLKMSKVEREESAPRNICLLGAKQTEKSLCWAWKWALRIKYCPYFIPKMLTGNQSLGWLLPDRGSSRRET